MALKGKVVYFWFKSRGRCEHRAGRIVRESGRGLTVLLAGMSEKGQPGWHGPKVRVAYREDFNGPMTGVMFRGRVGAHREGAGGGMTQDLRTKRNATTRNHTINTLSELRVYADREIGAVCELVRDYLPVRAAERLRELSAKLAREAMMIDHVAAQLDATTIPSKMIGGAA